MRRKHSIAEARTNLPKLIREAESGKVVELTRRGAGVAVLIGQKEYERLTSQSLRFSEAWSTFSREIEIEQLEIDPDDVFGDVRDRSPGRNNGL